MSAIRTLLTVVAGAVAGVAGSLAVSRYTSSSSAPPVSPVSSSAAARSMAAGTASAAATDGSIEASGRAPSAAAREQIHAERIARVKREPVAASWAEKTASVLREGLAQLAADAGGFSVVEAECRSTSCLVTVQWPSFAAAEHGWHSILHERYETACGREMLLPRPKDPALPYRATAIFDCTASRTDAAAP